MNESPERWTVVISEEIRRWLDGLSDKDFARAEDAIERLKQHGTLLGPPHSKPLKQGLRELRFKCEDVPTRVTYYFDRQRRAITPTRFRKQRQNERREVDRALTAMKKQKREREENA